MVRYGRKWNDGIVNEFEKRLSNTENERRAHSLASRRNSAMILRSDIMLHDVQ